MNIKKKGYIFAADNHQNGGIMETKVKVSQDTLYAYLQQHGVKLVRLAEITGLSEGTLNQCFKHTVVNGGQPRSFSPMALIKINGALPLLAQALRQCTLRFGSSQTFTNNRGRTCDPALIEPIKTVIGQYFSLNVMCQQVLGWSKAMKHNILESRTGIAYGCVSKEDAERINTELMAVAGVLDSYEVVTDSDTAQTL